MYTSATLGNIFTIEYGYSNNTIKNIVAIAPGINDVVTKSDLLIKIIITVILITIIRINIKKYREINVLDILDMLMGLGVTPSS
jgi:hypothetical protein